jgi:pilus assembly protein FimV
VKEYWMTRRFWAGLVVIAACVGLAGDLLAFSVGEIDVQSAANEPFRAEVPFVLEPHERDRDLEVLLGTPQDYQLEKLPRAPILEHMHVILAPDKRDTVRIFSNVPITDEVFDLIVLVRSGKLTFVRNYHVELTEAATPEAQQTTVVGPVVRQANVDPIPSPQPTAPSPPPATAPEPVTPPTLPRVGAQADLPDLYGPIRQGETMYNIVSKLDVPKEQIWQAVVLLWSFNHGEFVRGNLHGLRLGAYLEVPGDLAERLGGMNKEASQQIIHGQWQAWRRRRMTTAAQVLAMTAELAVEKPEPAAETHEEPVDAQVPQPVATTQVAEAEIPPEEPAPDDSAASIAPQQAPAMPPVAEVAPPPEKPVPDDSTAAVAPPQVVRLPTDEGSSFVSTQELKLLLGNLENRLLRRLAPVQEPRGTAPFVSPMELQVSLQDLESRLTRRVEQMVTQGGAPPSPEPSAQPSPAPMPPGSFEFIAGIQMPPVAYLLTLINVVLLVFGLTLGWRWWRQNAKGEA